MSDAMRPLSWWHQFCEEAKDYVVEERGASPMECDLSFEFMPLPPIEPQKSPVQMLQKKDPQPVGVEAKRESLTKRSHHLPVEIDEAIRICVQQQLVDPQKIREALVANQQDEQKPWPWERGGEYQIHWTQAATAFRAFATDHPEVRWWCERPRPLRSRIQQVWTERLNPFLTHGLRPEAEKYITSHLHLLSSPTQVAHRLWALQGALYSTTTIGNFMRYKKFHYSSDDD